MKRQKQDAQGLYSNGDIPEARSSTGSQMEPRIKVRVRPLRESGNKKLRALNPQLICKLRSYTSSPGIQVDVIQKTATGQAATAVKLPSQVRESDTHLFEVWGFWGVGSKGLSECAGHLPWWILGSWSHPKGGQRQAAQSRLGRPFPRFLGRKELLHDL